MQIGDFGGELQRGVGDLKRVGHNTRGGEVDASVAEVANNVEGGDTDVTGVSERGNDAAGMFGGDLMAAMDTVMVETEVAPAEGGGAATNAVVLDVLTDGNNRKLAHKFSPVKEKGGRGKRRTTLVFLA